MWENQAGGYFKQQEEQRQHYQQQQRQFEEAQRQREEMYRQWNRDAQERQAAYNRQVEEQRQSSRRLEEEWQRSRNSLNHAASQNTQTDYQPATWSSGWSSATNDSPIELPELPDWLKSFLAWLGCGALIAWYFFNGVIIDLLK